MSQNKNLPKRSETDSKYTWAIEDLYTSDELWQKEYDKVKEMLPRAAEFQGRLGKAAEILLSFLKLSDELGKLMERVYVYANQKYHEDTANAVYQDLSNKAAALMVQVNSTLSFATPEILTIPEETIVQYKHEEEELLQYDFYLADILRMKAPYFIRGDGRVTGGCG